MSILILFPALAIVLLSFVALAFLGIWTYRDAKARGLNAVLWLLVVLLVPSMIGLVIYLAVGRNQSVALCADCGAGLSADDRFCRKCGAIAKADGDQSGPRPIAKGGNRGPLIGFFVCLGSAVLMTLALIVTAALAPLIYQSSRHVEYAREEVVPAPVQDEAQRIVDGLSIGVIESNIGNQWNIRFARLGGDHRKDFTFTQDQELVVNSAVSEGTLQINISAADDTRYETYVLTGGEERFSLREFVPGTLRVTLTADATDGNISIAVK